EHDAQDLAVPVGKEEHAAPPVLVDLVRSPLRLAGVIERQRDDVVDARGVFERASIAKCHTHGRRILPALRKLGERRDAWYDPPAVEVGLIEKPEPGEFTWAMLRRRRPIRRRSPSTRSRRSPWTPSKRRSPATPARPWASRTSRTSCGPSS